MITETVRMGALDLRFLQTKQGTGSSLNMFEMTVRPAARMPVPHFHESWDETIYGLTGTTTWRIEDETVDVGAGQSVFIRRGTVHGFSNPGPQPVTCLCVLTPGTLDPAYFREVAARIEAGGTDKAAMQAVMLRHGLVPAP